MGTDTDKINTDGLTVDQLAMLQVEATLGAEPSIPGAKPSTARIPTYSI